MKHNLLKTEGIVIRSIPYRETSKILTFLTKDLGKIKAIAKGGRSPKSMLRVALETLTHSEIVIYMREERELQIIKEASAINSYEIFRVDYKRFRWGCELARIADILLDINSPFKDIYKLFAKSLYLISVSSESSLPLILWGFTLKSLSLLGHRPNLRKCVKCGCMEFLNYISVKDGGVICNDCSKKFGDVFIYSESLIKKLKLLLFQSQNSLSRIEVNMEGVEEFIAQYINYHIGRTLKERKVK